MGAVSEIVAQAAGELLDALELGPDVPAWDDPGQDITPPCTMIGPPLLRWEGQWAVPTSARFLVYVIEQLSAGAVERLWDLVPVVAETLDQHTGGVVIEASPAVYLQGNTQLPCYELVVEVPLNG